MNLRKKGILKYGKTRIRFKVKNVKWNILKKDNSYKKMGSHSKINTSNNCSSIADIDTGTSTTNGKKLIKKQIKERLLLMKQLLQEFIYNDKVLTKNVTENWLQQLLSYNQFCSDDEEIVQICDKLLNQLDFVKLDVSCSSSNYSSQNSMISDIEMESIQISNQKDCNSIVSAVTNVLSSNFKNLTIQENCLLNEMTNGSNSSNQVTDDKGIETATNLKNPFKCNNVTNSAKLVEVISVVNITEDFHNSTNEKDIVSMDISSSQETYYEKDSTIYTDLNNRLEDNLNQTEKLDLSQKNKQETEHFPMIDTSKIVNCSSLSEIVLTDSVNQTDNGLSPEANNGSNIILYTSTLEFTQTEEMLNSGGIEDLNQAEIDENINPECNKKCISKTIGLAENNSNNNDVLILSENEYKAKLSQCRKSNKKAIYKYPCRSKQRLLSQEIISNGQLRIDKIFKQNKLFSTLKNNDSVEKMIQAPQEVNKSEPTPEFVKPKEVNKFKDIDNSPCSSAVYSFERQKVTDSQENGIELLKLKTNEERLSPETKIRKTECIKNKCNGSLEKSKVRRFAQEKQCDDEKFNSEIRIQKHNAKISKNCNINAFKNIKLIKKPLGVNNEIITVSGNSQLSRKNICIENSPLRCSGPSTLRNSETLNNDTNYVTINGQCSSDNVSAVKINQPAVLKLDKNTSTSDFEVIKINNSCSHVDNLKLHNSVNKSLLFTSEKIDVSLIDEAIDEYKAHVQMLLSNFCKNLNKENSVTETSQIDKTADVSKIEQNTSISLFSKSFIQKHDNEVSKFAKVNNFVITVQSNSESVNKNSDIEIKNMSQVIEQKIVSTVSTEQDSAYSSLCTGTLQSSFKVPIERKVNIKRRDYKKIDEDSKNDKNSKMYERFAFDLSQCLMTQSQDQPKFISGELGSPEVNWIINNTKQTEETDLNYTKDVLNSENLTLDANFKSLRSQSFQSLISEESENPEKDREVLDNTKQTEDTYLNYTKYLSNSQNVRLDNDLQSLRSQNWQFLGSEKSKNLEIDHGLFENTKQTENTYSNYTKDISETQNLTFDGNFISLGLRNFQKELNASHKFGFRNKFRKKISIEDNSDNVKFLPFYHISPTHSKSVDTTVANINSQINFSEQLFSDSRLVSQSVIEVANSSFNSIVRKKLITGQKLKEVPVPSQSLTDENYD